MLSQVCTHSVEPKAFPSSCKFNFHSILSFISAYDSCPLHEFEHIQSSCQPTLSALILSYSFLSNLKLFIMSNRVAFAKLFYVVVKGIFRPMFLFRNSRSEENIDYSFIGTILTHFFDDPFLINFLVLLKSGASM